MSHQVLSRLASGFLVSDFQVWLLRFIGLLLPVDPGQHLHQYPIFDLKGGCLRRQGLQRPLPAGMQASSDIWELRLKTVNRRHGLLSTIGLAQLTQVDQRRLDWRGDIAPGLGGLSLEVKRMQAYRQGGDGLMVAVLVSR